MAAATPETADERALVARLNLEAKEQTSLRALDDWYAKRCRELCAPVDEAGQSLVRDAVADAPDPGLREPAHCQDVDRKHALLNEVYEQAVAEFLGQAADELVAPDSAAFHDTVERFDSAWRELANR
jgi:hypothetical protein